MHVKSAKEFYLVNSWGQFIFCCNWIWWYIFIHVNVIDFDSSSELFSESSSLCEPALKRECAIQAKSGAPMVPAQCFFMRAHIRAALSFIVSASTWSYTFADLLVPSANQRPNIRVHVHQLRWIVMFKLSNNLKIYKCEQIFRIFLIRTCEVNYIPRLNEPHYGPYYTQKNELIYKNRKVQVHQEAKMNHKYKSIWAIVTP